MVDAKRWHYLWPIANCAFGITCRDCGNGGIDDRNRPDGLPILPPEKGGTGRVPDCVPWCDVHHGGVGALYHRAK